jgi:hypothetical protein
MPTNQMTQIECCIRDCLDVVRETGRCVDACLTPQRAGETSEVSAAASTPRRSRRRLLS